MNLICIALLSPALWAITNHIDKYLIDTQLQRRGVSSLLLFSSLIGLFAITFILAIHPQVLGISPLNAAVVIMSGVIYMLGLLPYYYALQKDEASIVVPLFQATTIFSYGLGLIIGESLIGQQIAASLFIICGSILLSIEFKPRRSNFKFEVFVLMMLASFLNTLNFLLFKLVAIQEDFWVTSFWEYIGFALFAIFLLTFIKPYRKEFLTTIRQNKFIVLGLVTLNEAIGIVAKTTNIALLTIPLALISTLHGLQPLFVFIYGVMLKVYLPRYSQERMERKILLQQLIAIALTMIGTCVIAAL